MKTIEGQGSSTMKGIWVLLGVLGVFLLLAIFGFGSYVSSKNQMVALSADVDRSYSDMDVVLQRRLDLIPNLVASVKGYVGEEETVLTNIANARAGVIAAGSDRASSIDANKRLDVAISPLLRLQEQYPNLKGNQQFTRLEDELSGTENRIYVARERYNKILEGYNVYIQQFPNSVWAGMAGYHVRNEYYKADAAAQKAPTVDFGK
jgi:LemA protein